MPQAIQQYEPLLTTSEVGRLFKVDTRTVNRWSKNYSDRLTPVKTPGGHLRFSKAQVMALLNGGTQERQS